MAQTKYTYSIAVDTANALLAEDSLKKEIEDSSIIIALDYIAALGDVLDIYMKDALSTGDKTTLDAIVTSHEGVGLASDPTLVAIDSEPAAPPFAAKVTPEGKNLFARTTGKKFTLSAGANTLDFDITYAHCKITGMEIVGSKVGDTLDFLVLDDDSGTYSGTANAVLNQFGYDVAMPDGFYKRESNYDADLYLNMTISIEYDSESAKDVYINYVLHEVKD
jgi:hypothetical protein